VPSLCTPEGWCWENPLPQGFNLNAALRLDARRTWFVGENRVVVFFDGDRSRLQEVPAPPGAELFAIHGTANNDVFVVGSGGVILHYDGTRWEREGTLAGFTNPLRTVWSFGDGGALAAGPQGKLLSRAAEIDPFSRWTLETFPSVEEVVEVFADSAGGVYAVTRRNELFTRSTGNWERLDTVPLTETLAATPRGDGLLFGGSAADRANLVQRDPDGGWRELTDAGFTTTGFARGDGGVFALSNALDFAWLDEADQFTRFVVQPGQWNAGAALPGPRLLLVGPSGSTAVVTLDGGLTWRSTPRPTRGQSFNAICGASPGAMYAVGGIDNGSACPTCKVKWLERSVTDGVPAWASKDFQLGNTVQLLGCYAENAERVWLTGDDSKFVYLSNGEPDAGDFGGGAFAGRYSGAWGNPDAGYFFARRESAELTLSPDGLSGFVLSGTVASGAAVSVWGFSSTDVRVAGLNGATSFFDGASWWQDSLSTTSDFASLHGAALRDGGTRYVAAGSRGTIATFDGDAGALTELSPAVDFHGAWVSASGRAWAAGSASDGGAFVMRNNGSGWTNDPLISPRPVRGVFGFDRDDGGVSVWLAGPQGMILRKDY
jgi:hypothetical protein